MLRRRTLRTISVALLALAADLASTHARAAKGAVRVDVTDDGGCVDAARFSRALFGRIRRPRGGLDADDTVVGVSVTPAPEGYVGRLAIAEPGAPARERRVAARSCGELELSLVVVAAIALGGEDAPSDAEPPSAGPPDAAEPTEPPAPRRPAPITARRTFLGARAGFSDLGGGLAPSADLFVGGEPAGSGIALGWRLALGVMRATSQEPRAALHATPLTLRADLSFVQLVTTRLRAGLGGAVEPGLVFADTGGQVRGGLLVRPWLRAGLAAQALVPVSRALGIELDGALLVPVLRDSLDVEGTSLEVRAPVVGAGVRLGVRLTLE